MATRKRTSAAHPGPARRALTPRGKAPGLVPTPDAALQQLLQFEPNAYLKDLVRSVQDFPKPGILFRDISPVLADPKAFALAVDAMSTRFIALPLEAVVAIEARGFIFGAAIAHRLGVSFVPVRKPGKLPCDFESVSYALEYGSEELQMHKDALNPGARVLVVDDVLATGGTAAAACELVRKANASVAASVFFIELTSLKGAERLGSTPVLSVLKY